MTAIDLLYARRRRASHAQSAQLEQYAFHGTSKANLKAIRAVGLLPKNGENTTNDEGRDVEAKVCLALDPKTAQKYAGKDGVVLKVDLDHPYVTSAIPKEDQHTDASVTVNQRVPPEAIKVLKPRESTALALARWSEGYARDQRLKAEVSEAEWRPNAEKVAQEYGFIQDYHADHGNLGKVSRFFHPRGDRLIVTSRENFDRQISQHAHWQDRLKGVSGNWQTRWEYHSISGIKSTGYDIWGLEDHLKRYHGAQTA